jgi:hypothetical protein
MNKINVGRVLLSGLVAGVVFNIGEAVLNTVLLAQAMEADLQRLKLPPVGGSFIIRAVSITFLLGIVLMFLYAALRPRFEARGKAAICAGLLAWFFVYFYAGYLYYALGVNSLYPFVAGLGWGALEYILAALAGAWVYKEAE